MYHGDTAAATLLTGGHGYAPPVGQFFIGALGFKAQHTAFAHHGLDAGHTELGGFFNQPVHTLIGRHADDQMYRPWRFALGRGVGPNGGLHIAAAHAGNGGCKLAFTAFLAFPQAIEQRDPITRLQAQHLNMPRGVVRQGDLAARDQGDVSVETGAHGGALSSG